MNPDSKEVVTSENKKPCAFCIFVRVFAIVTLLLTIAFYLFVKSQERAVVTKENSVMRATIEADMR